MLVISVESQIENEITTLITSAWTTLLYTSLWRFIEEIKHIGFGLGTLYSSKVQVPFSFPKGANDHKHNTGQ